MSLLTEEKNERQICYLSIIPLKLDTSLLCSKFEYHLNLVKSYCNDKKCKQIYVFSTRRMFECLCMCYYLPTVLIVFNRDCPYFDPKMKGKRY